MDANAKRYAMRMLSYGLYILTVTDGEQTAAATITWLAQASLTPPLVMVGVKVDSNTHTLLQKTGKFAVNIVGEGQKEIAAAFFKPSRIEGDTINGYQFEAGPQTGAPLLPALPAWFEAHITDTVKRGDHTIYVAELIEAGVRDKTVRPLPLADTGWSYGG